MANRKIELAARYLTAPQVREKLSLSRFELNIRIERGILPAPTLTDGAVRYFDEQWVKTAKAILASLVKEES